MKSKGVSVHAKTINGIANDETHKRLQELYNSYRSCRKNSKLDESDLKIVDLRFRVILQKNDPETIQEAKDLHQYVQQTGKAKPDVWNLYKLNMVITGGDIVQSLRAWYATLRPKQSSGEGYFPKPTSINHKTLKAKHD